MKSSSSSGVNENPLSPTIARDPGIAEPSKVKFRLFTVSALIGSLNTTWITTSLATSRLPLAGETVASCGRTLSFIIASDWPLLSTEVAVEILPEASVASTDKLFVAFKFSGTETLKNPAAEAGVSTAAKPPRTVTMLPASASPLICTDDRLVISTIGLTNGKTGARVSGGIVRKLINCTPIGGVCKGLPQTSRRPSVSRT